jgi:RHS repeat-associated protein
VGSRLSYDPWGKLTETGSVLSDFTYMGHYYGRQAGLSLAWFRGYDPNLGRWLSQDPIGLKDGPILYGYVGDDPANFYDPLGKSAVPFPIPIPVGPAIGIGAAAGVVACYLCPECRAFFAKKWKDICEPAQPKDPPQDCHQKCARYMGPLKKCVNNSGEVIRNDRPGNAQYAFYECLKECNEGI